VVQRGGELGVSVAVDKVIHALKQHGCDPQPCGTGHQSRCPVAEHEDKNPSLSIGEGTDGRALICCHGGCQLGDVVGSMGLTESDLFCSSNGTAAPPRPRKAPARRAPVARAARPRGSFEIAEVYPYCDEDGIELFQSCRLKPKNFRLRRLNGDGKYTWSAKGIRRVLYHLPEIIAAAPEATIFVCEGEKDVDRLRDLGLVATTSAMGAGHWDKTDHTALHGRRVVALADNDQPGREYAAAVAASLHGRGGTVKVLELPGLAEHGDVSDWLDLGNDPEDLDELGARSPEWQPPATSDDLELVRSVSADAPMTRAGAIKERQEIFNSFNDENAAKMATCIKLAKFFEPGGSAEILGDTRGPLPLAYFAGPMGCTVARISQRVAAGRLMLDVVYPGKHPDPLADHLTERHLRPIQKLEPDRQEQAIARGFEIARERHVIDTAQREAMGRKSRQLTARASHFAEAVREMLPEPGAADEDSSKTVFTRVNALLVLAQSIPRCPRRVIESLKASRREIQAWNA